MSLERKEKLLKNAVADYFNNCCFYCGYPNVKGIDHFLPIEFLTEENPEYWILTCRRCNSIKYAHKFDTVKQAVTYIQNEIKKVNHKLFRVYTTKELQAMQYHFCSNKELASILQSKVPNYEFLFYKEEGLINILNKTMNRKHKELLEDIIGLAIFAVAAALLYIVI